jgi:hypothetical protein
VNLAPSLAATARHASGILPERRVAYRITAGGGVREVPAIANVTAGTADACHAAGDESMRTEEDTGMNLGWGRVLIGIGVIIALLTLGALEVLTARLPADEPLAGQANPDNGAAGPWQDFLDGRPQLAAHDRGAPSVDEKSETDRAVVAAGDARFRR